MINCVSCARREPLPPSRDRFPVASSLVARVCVCLFPFQGTSARQGKRRYMEDRHIVVPSLCVDPSSPPDTTPTAPGVAGTAVCSASAHDDTCMPPVAMFGLFDGHGGAETAQFAVERLPSLVRRSCCEGDGDVAAGLRAAFEAVDSEFTTTHPSRFRTGSTCTVAVLDGRGRGSLVLHVAHVGDSRAVLCRGGVAVPLVRNTAHLASDEGEMGDGVQWEGEG